MLATAEKDLVNSAPETDSPLPPLDRDYVLSR